MVERWREFVVKGGAAAGTGLSEAGAAACAEFAAAMNDDMNVAGAIGAINTFINRTPNPGPGDAAALELMDGVLGVVALARRDAAATNDAPRSPEDLHIDDLVHRRTEARKTKNWPEADKIRDELVRLNVVVEDTASGPKWSRKAGF